MERPRAKGWVIKAMARHAERLSLPDAPSPGSELFEDNARAWEIEFSRVAANAMDVDRASLALMADPPSWWREQLKALVDAIEAERASNPARPEFPDVPAPDDRKSAEAASRTCTDCGGSGFAEVFHREYDGAPYVERVDAYGEVHRHRARFRIWCDCPLGKWFKLANERSAANAKDSFEADRQRDVVRAMSWIAAARAGVMEYVLGDPSAPPVEMPTEGGWRDHVRAWADAAGDPSRDVGVKGEGVRR